MRLERIATIWAKEDNASAGLPRHWVGTSEGADHLADRGAVILYVFNHFVAEDQVEVPRWERQGFAGGVDNMRRIGPRFGRALKVIFQSDDFSSKRGEMFHIHAHPASIFKDTSPDAVSRAAHDHVQSAFLARAPDVGWLTA